jgi:hypothetical protein
MPKTRKHFRLSEQAIATVKTYATTHDLKTFTQALEQIILENPRLHMYISYLGDIRQLGKEVQCYKRIFFNGEYYCAIRPPKAVKLLTLDICLVCKAKGWNIPFAENQTKQKTADPAPVAPPLPASPAKVYCPNGGYSVPAYQCQSCRRPCGKKTPQ